MQSSFKRGIIVGIGFILQITLTVLVYRYLVGYLKIIELFYRGFSLVIVLYIIKNSTRLSKDVPWIIIICLAPIIGTILLFVLGRNYNNSKLMKAIRKSIKNSYKYLKLNPRITNEIEREGLDQLKYIQDTAKFPVSKNNDISYYSMGDKVYPEMLKELRKAEKFIFIEYFLIGKGKMWNSILEILVDKVKQGVDVRIIYDDIGSIRTLSTRYPKELESYGIKCIQFNKVNPLAGIIMNNRDHRKMMIIDGRVVFSGGINLSDEYINLKERFGKWKDNGIKITGDAVWNFTVMFLSMWNANKVVDKDYTKYKYDFKSKSNNESYVVPYGDNPLDEEVVGEDIYLNIINQAKKKLYIFTPYLIIDNNMINSLVLAAKRGVDVRIVVPSIPDKKAVYLLTKSYFNNLRRGGVKIYTYTPGFIHSKVFLCDDKIATVGTINLDYRSLYLHFECGVYIMNHRCIREIRKDFDNTFLESHKVTKKDIKVGFLNNLWQAVLRMFAPLL